MSFDGFFDTNQIDRNDITQRYNNALLLLTENSCCDASHEGIRPPANTMERAVKQGAVTLQHQRSLGGSIENCIKGIGLKIV